ncbi:hypothetical protein D3C84_522510 [compost metagenome]
MAIAEATQFGRVLGKAFKVSRFIGQVAVTPGQVAGNLKLFDPPTDDLHRFQAHEFHLANAVCADHVSELVQAMADAANQLPAVAAAGAPADLVGFEQHHAEAALGQFDGGVQAGKTAAYHAHVSQQLALEHWVIRLRQAAGGVIGGGVVARNRLLNTGVHGGDPEFSVLSKFYGA